MVPRPEVRGPGTLEACGFSSHLGMGVAKDCHWRQRTTNLGGFQRVKMNHLFLGPGIGTRCKHAAMEIPAGHLGVSLGSWYWLLMWGFNKRQSKDLTMKENARVQGRWTGKHKIEGLQTVSWKKLRSWDSAASWGSRVWMGVLLQLWLHQLSAPEPA